jgi:SpoVK/Ycf46/Vps4 family AAA+-type ATPase
VVPVLYQQDPLTLDFAAQSTAPVHHDSDRIPAEARDDANPYGLIGRDNALLQLERALRRPPAGVLINGLAGVGKTTLAKGYLKWLLDTGGLSEPCIWFSFNDIHSGEYVINRLVAEVLGTDALVLDLAQKIEKLVQALRDRPVLIVWDNFESVCGIPGTEVQALLSPADRDQLRGLLYKLRGGKTRIIITSRGPEDWLAPIYCFRLPLGGIQGEERWSYCEVVIRDLGLSLNRDDPELIGLMDLLDGHPLMMRVLLLQLNQRSAAALATELRDRFEHARGAENEEQSKLFATLRFVEDAVPNALRALLVPLALHERFTDADYLEAMAKAAGSSYPREQIDQLLASLEHAGLVQHHGQAVYAMHPALSGFLRSRIALQEAMHEPWRRAFVEVMERLANHLAPKAGSWTRADALSRSLPSFCGTMTCTARR